MSEQQNTPEFQEENQPAQDGQHLIGDTPLQEGQVEKNEKNSNATIPHPANQSPRCTAHKRITKEPCGLPAMKNGKCRLNGGKSTGPKTPEGLEKCRLASWKHGYRSAKGIALQKEIRLFYREALTFLANLNASLK